MNLIIPLTGNGSRFKVAGYKRLKPFIKIHDIEMICWVRSMFPKKEFQKEGGASLTKLLKKSEE